MTKRILLLLLAFLLIISIGAIFWIKPANIPGLSSSQTWQIILSYNTNNQTLALKKITTLNQSIRPDNRGAADSPYELSVFSKKKVLYLTKIHVTEELSHNIWMGYPSASASSAPEPTVLETAVFIPYFDNASKIQISREGKIILNFEVKRAYSSFLRRQESNYLWIPAFARMTISNVFAQSLGSPSGPIKVVIMGDYFPSLAQFQQQAQTLITALEGAPPYAGINPPIFDFIVASSNTGFGCALPPGPFQGACTESAIKGMGYTFSSQATKFIVIVNNDLTASPPIAFTNDVGGDVSIMGINWPRGATLGKTGIHEFLGHGVGELYDRYTLTSKPGIKRGIKSNCSDNPAGEAFWKEAGANGPYPQPCDTPGLYAPFTNDCPSPPSPPPGYQGPIMTSGGSRGSIMSAIDCWSPEPQFDAVEQAWIRTYIIPRYQGVSFLAPTPTPSRTTQSGSTPTPNVSRDNCSASLSEGQIVRGDVLTYVSATRSNSSYNTSLILLNSKIGDLVGATAESDSLTVSWNSQDLFQNGPAVIRCRLTSPTTGGNIIFTRDVTVNVQN